jgi:hypothetical protein
MLAESEPVLFIDPKDVDLWTNNVFKDESVYVTESALYTKGFEDGKADGYEV